MIPLPASHERPDTDACDHPIDIPGLDASFCKACRTWWVDEPLRQAILDRKRAPNGPQSAAQTRPNLVPGQTHLYPVAPNAK